MRKESLYKTWEMRMKYLEGEKRLGETIDMQTWTEWEKWISGVIYVLRSKYNVDKAICVAEERYLCKIYEDLTDAKKYNIEQSVQAFIDRILDALSIAKQHKISLPEMPQSLVQFLKMVPGFEV
jgi:hypothetical protein